MFYEKYFELFNIFKQNYIKNFRRNSWLKENGFYEVATCLISDSFFKDKSKFLIANKDNTESYCIEQIAERYFNLDKLVDTLNIKYYDETYNIIPIIKDVQYIPEEANGDISKSVKIDLNVLDYKLIQYTAWNEEYLSSCGDEGELIREYMTVPLEFGIQPEVLTKVTTESKEINAYNDGIDYKSFSNDDNVIKLVLKITTATNNIQVLTKYNPDIIEKILCVNVGFMVKKIDIKSRS